MWRSSCRYQWKPERNQELREQLVELAHQRPRFGYWGLGVLLSREGQHINKRLFRVYRTAGLSVKRNRRKKLVRVERKIATSYIQPGKPMQNGQIESFNGRLRDEGAF